MNGTSMMAESVLVVDDNRDFLGLADQILAPFGYEIHLAFDGIDGLEKLRQVRPDLIMLDMHMPRMSGMQLLATLRHEGFTAPVIFMTAEGSEVIAIQAFRLGVVDYLMKPMDTVRLTTAVERALQSVRLAREKKELLAKLHQAKAVQQTIVALSHHFNNHLTAANGGIDLLYELLKQEKIKRSEPEMRKIREIYQNGHASLEEMAQILKKLQHITTVNLVKYDAGTDMIDITTALQELTEFIHPAPISKTAAT